MARNSWSVLTFAPFMPNERLVVKTPVVVAAAALAIAKKPADAVLMMKTRTKTAFLALVFMKS